MSGPAVSQLLAEVFDRLDYWDDGFVDGLVALQLHVDVISTSITIRIRTHIFKTGIYVGGLGMGNKSYEGGVGWFWQ